MVGYLYKKGQEFDEMPFLKERYPQCIDPNTGQKCMSIICLGGNGIPGIIIVHDKLNILFSDKSPVHILLLGGEYSAKESEAFYGSKDDSPLDLFLKVENRIRFIGKFHILGRTSDVATINQLRLMNSNTKGDYTIHSAMYLISKELVENYLLGESPL